MMSHAGHPEEGTRNAVAECLGRVTLLQPLELVPRLHAEVCSNAQFPFEIKDYLIKAVS